MLQKMCRCIKRNKGMTTIEACVIIPLILSSVLLLIGICIFYYNQAVLSGVAAEAAIEASNYSHLNNAEIMKVAEQTFAEKIDGELVLMEEPVVSVLVTLNEIRVCAEADFVMSGFNRFNLFNTGDDLKIFVEKKSPRLNQSSFVRTFEAILNREKADSDN